MSKDAPRVLASIRWPRPFAGLEGIGLAGVPREAMAGVTLAALMIPLNIGYAQVAGLPPAAGLYAAIIPLAVFALLASSRHLVTSPDASMATLVGAALVGFAAPGTPERLQYALALAFVCAALFLLFWIFRLAFLANFLSRAVVIAFLLSVIDVIRRASHPATASLQEAPDGSHFVPVEAGQTSGCPGLVLYRFGAPLYFANATLFLDEVEQLIARAPKPVRWFVLDAEAMVDVDTTGAGVLRQAISLLKKQNITFAVSRADRAFRSWLERYELMELIDPERFYPTNRHAAAAFREGAGKAKGA